MVFAFVGVCNVQWRVSEAVCGCADGSIVGFVSFSRGPSIQKLTIPSSSST